MADKPDDEHITGPPPAFRGRLAAGEFVVTAEIGPPRGADTSPVATKAGLLRSWVDAVNITDNQSAAVRLSSLAGSLAALRAGVEPIMQLTCRDRNRIALQSELLSASALGVPNVLIMTGDHPRHGDHSDATPVFDLDSTQLLRVATAMRDQGRLMSGGELKPPPDWFLGAVENPPAPSAGHPAMARAADTASFRLAAKVEAGAQFVQTQFVFDVAAFASWLRQLADLGLLERCFVLAGVGPVRSQRALARLAAVPGVVIPERVADRLESTSSPEQFRAEGERLCAETIAGLTEVPGVAGVHVMAVGAESTIPSILKQAGLPERRVSR